MLIRSKLRHEWLGGFVLQVGDNHLGAIPPKAARRIEELRRAGLIEIVEAQAAPIATPAPMPAPEPPLSADDVSADGAGLATPRPRGRRRKVEQT